MVPNGQETKAPNIRPTITLFFGTDTFDSRDSYLASLGKYAPVQRVHGFSADAESLEWQEILQESFQLFTAVNRQQLADSGLVETDELQNVPMLIVVRREGVDRFPELVRTVVDVAAAQQLADKLEFIIITDVSRPEEIGAKAAGFHDAVSSIDSTVVQLQAGVLAISDYWRGASIGCEEKINLAIARIAALISMTEYDLHESHLGGFRNGFLGGKTFWVGLSIYSADRIDACSALIYADLLRDKLKELLAENPASIVRNLTDQAYESLLKTVGDRIGGVLPAPDTDHWSQLTARYQTDVAPAILDQIAAGVQGESELLTVLEHLAGRLRGREQVRKSAAMAMFPPILPAALTASLSTLGLSIAGLAVFALAAVWTYKQLSGRDEADGAEMSVSSEAQGAASPAASCWSSLPSDPILADVLDDLRRELTAKLQKTHDPQELSLLDHSPAGALMGEQCFRFKQMRKLTDARSAGASWFQRTPGSLLLLALESGKWRTSDECGELIKTQRNTVRAIATALRQEFTSWVADREIQRLQDYSFVQEVLYSPPPPAGASISAFCFAPHTWDVSRWPVAIDRCTFANSFHFIYLVQHTNVSTH